MYVYLAFGALFIGLGLLFLYLYQKQRKIEKSILFYGGLGHILLGMPILFSWFLFYAIGIILIGIVFLFLSRYPISKILQSCILIIPISIFLLWSFYEESSYNIFLIPEGYRGRVLIVHDCADGQEKEFEGRYRVYRISKGGLLKTKFSFAGDSFDSLHSKYFYVDSKGNRTAILEEEGDSKENEVLVQGVWTLPPSNGKVTNIDFIIDKKVENPHSYRPEEKDFWQKKIDGCRK